MVIVNSPLHGMDLAINNEAPLLEDIGLLLYLLGGLHIHGSHISFLHTQNTHMWVGILKDIYIDICYFPLSSTKNYKSPTTYPYTLLFTKFVAY